MHPSINFFAYFKECSDTEESLAYPSGKLVKTIGSAVTLMESIMAEVAHLIQWSSTSQLQLKTALIWTGLHVLAVQFTSNER